VVKARAYGRMGREEEEEDDGEREQSRNWLRVCVSCQCEEEVKKRMSRGTNKERIRADDIHLLGFGTTSERH
jgi:hypothetical protein